MIYILNRCNPLNHRVLHSIYTFLGNDKTRLLNIKKHWLKYLFSYVKSNDYIIVPDPFVFLTCLLLKPLSRKKILYFSFEMYGYTKPNKGVKNKIINTIWRILQFWALVFSYKVIFSNGLRKDFYVKKYPWLKGQTFIFENYSLKTNKPNVASRLKEKIDAVVKNKQKVWIAYAGSLQPGRNIKFLIDAFNKAENKNIGFIIAGRDLMDIKSAIGNKKDIVYIGNLSFDETSYLYTKIQYGFMDYSNDFLNTKYCAPLKLYEYLQYNLGIICNNNYAMLEKKNLIDFYYNNEKDLIKILSSLDKQKVKEKKTEGLDFNTQFKKLLTNMKVNL